MDAILPMLAHAGERHSLTDRSSLKHASRIPVNVRMSNRRIPIKGKRRKRQEGETKMASSKIPGRIKRNDPSNGEKTKETGGDWEFANCDRVDAEKKSSRIPMARKPKTEGSRKAVAATKGVDVKKGTRRYSILPEIAASPPNESRETTQKQQQQHEDKKIAADPVEQKQIESKETMIELNKEIFNLQYDRLKDKQKIRAMEKEIGELKAKESRNELITLQRQVDYYKSEFECAKEIIDCLHHDNTALRDHGNNNNNTDIMQLLIFDGFDDVMPPKQPKTERHLSFRRAFGQTHRRQQLAAVKE